LVKNLTFAGEAVGAEKAKIRFFFRIYNTLRLLLKSNYLNT